jgi:hypothetical protein
LLDRCVCQKWCHQPDANSAKDRLSAGGKTEWTNVVASCSPRNVSKDNRRLTADRIQARALDRVGELMRQIPPAKTGPKLESPGELQFSPREQARIAAGLSPRQAKDALSINADAERNC